MCKQSTMAVRSFEIETTPLATLQNFISKCTDVVDPSKIYNNVKTEQNIYMANERVEIFMVFEL